MTCVRLSKKIEFGPKSRTKPGAKTRASEPPPLRFPPVFRLRRSWRHEQGPQRGAARAEVSVAEPKDGYPGGRLPPIRRASARGWFFVRRSSAQHVSSSEFDSTKFHHQKENKFEMKSKSPRKKNRRPFMPPKKTLWL
jgi:hypothetical protein